MINMRDSVYTSDGLLQKAARDIELTQPTEFPREKAEDELLAIPHTNIKNIQDVHFSFNFLRAAARMARSMRHSIFA